MATPLPTCAECCCCNLAVNGDPKATAVLTFAGVTLPAMALDLDSTHFGAGGIGYSVTASLCAGDGQFHFNVALWCVNNGWWIQVDAEHGLTGEFWSWNFGAAAPLNPSSYSLRCSPFHFHWEGLNNFDSGTNTYCGITFGPAGSTFLSIDIDAAVYPPCPSWGSLPSTATLTYTVGAMAQETMNLTKSGSSYSGSKTCDLGDGHRVIWQSVLVQCVSGLWSMVFDQFILVDGLTVSSSATWSTGNVAAGDVMDPTFTIATSPFHAHLAKNNATGGTSGGATVLCGGKTYPFGTGIAGVFDVVTP